MKKMEWSDNLSIGVELIDEQHKTWIGHLNKVANALETAQGPAVIAMTLDFLSDYTGFHFSTEEKHMTANDYPGLDDHKAKHAELKATLNDLMHDFEEDGATKPLADAVNTFLGNWLIDHIRDVDQAFGAFLDEKGIVLDKES